ncbi:MAG: hypothetical protein ACJ8F4_02380 [Sphingomonas sp.]|jgi:hypothetical protein
MVALMSKGVILLVPLLASAAAAFAGASNFTLVNGTGAGLANLTIRRAGTQDWKPLGTAPAAGARGAINFTDKDCAFDIRAEVNGKGPVTWTDVNLCDVKSVKLNHDGSAGAWVDYDH